MNLPPPSYDQLRDINVELTRRVDLLKTQKTALWKRLCKADEQLDKLIKECDELVAKHG